MPATIDNDPVAAEVWRETVRELEPLGLLSPLDGPTLETYALAASMARAAADQIRADGLVVANRRSKVKHPAWPQFVAATDTLLRTARVLGATPAARARMPQPPPDLDDSDLD